MRALATEPTESTYPTDERNEGETVSADDWTDGTDEPEPPSALDKRVDAKRPKKPDAMVQGSEVGLIDVELWPDAVNGDIVLNEVSEAFVRYLVLPAGAADALTLWCAHSHAFRAFICSP
ncbi:MAG: hypothetical protein ABJB69_06915, partial [Spartobacteria bacterium]